MMMMISGLTANTQLIQLCGTFCTNLQFQQNAANNNTRAFFLYLDGPLHSKICKWAAKTF